jgi:hypothetical protein
VFSASRLSERFRDVDRKIDTYLSIIPVISYIGIARRLDGNPSSRSQSLLVRVVLLPQKNLHARTTPSSASTPNPSCMLRLSAPWPPPFSSFSSWSRAEQLGASHLLHASADGSCAGGDLRPVRELAPTMVPPGPRMVFPLASPLHGRL